MPNYNWNRSTRRIRVSDEEKAETSALEKEKKELKPYEDHLV